MESPTFELSSIEEWVEANDYKRIALQFPRDLLPYAPEILLELEKRSVDRQFYILADTSYRRFVFLVAGKIKTEKLNLQILMSFCIKRFLKIWPFIFFCPSLRGT